MEWKDPWLLTWPKSFSNNLPLKATSGTRWESGLLGIFSWRPILYHSLAYMSSKLKVEWSVVNMNMDMFPDSTSYLDISSSYLSLLFLGPSGNKFACILHTESRIILEKYWYSCYWYHLWLTTLSLTDYFVTTKRLEFTILTWWRELKYVEHTYVRS